VDDSGTASGTSANQITGPNGVAIFTGLKYDQWYLLEETDVPVGYLGAEKAWVKLNADDSVTVTSVWGSETDHDAVKYSGLQTVTVTNTSLKPLPETGGTGTALYQWSGLLLMAAAVLLFIDKRPRRKEGTPS